METREKMRKIFLSLVLLALVLVFVSSSCVPAPPIEEAPPEVEVAPPEVEEAPPEPRAEMLIVNIDGGAVEAPGNFNPFSAGFRPDPGVHQTMIEALFYYNLETGEIIPWQAEGYEYNEDYTEVTLSLRKGVEWSDGMPFTADDVVFTIDMLLKNAPTLTHSAALAEWVKEVSKVDDHTVRFILTKPNPRFVLNQLTVEIYWSVYIVPKHIWENVDPVTFENYDPAKGWPVFTGPYRIVKATMDEFAYERRDDWWGAKTGFRRLPEPKQVVWITGTEETRAALMARKELDAAGYITAGTFEVIKAKNPNVIAWHEELPYAWTEPVPLHLAVNNQIPPWNDPEIRWAINYALDREEMVAVAWEGIAIPIKSIFPDTAPLLAFVDQNQDLFEKYPVLEHNPEKTKEILEGKGFQQGEDGIWRTPEGKRLELTVEAPAPWPEQKKLAMVIAEQLQRVGIDASVRVMEAGAWHERAGTGESEMWPFWIGGAISDPYPSFDQFHSKWVKPIGEWQDFNWARWVNKEFDQIVDEMAVLLPEDPEYQRLAREALEIWLRELPVIPTTSQPALLPVDTTYWTNWPTAKNNYMQPYYQCASMLPLIIELEAAQK
jgi:peptide/nickel transport system substrate-binding protein